MWIEIEWITYVSVYLTSNDTAADLRTKLDDLEDTLRNINGEIIVAGDLNAKAMEWGMEVTDRRGQDILDMAARLHLDILNTADTTTFIRVGYRETILDVTFASETIARRVTEWRVIEDYTGSDHQYITFALSGTPSIRGRDSRPASEWNISEINEEILISIIKSREAELFSYVGTAGDVVDAAMTLVRRACDASMPRRKCRRGGNRTVDW